MTYYCKKCHNLGYWHETVIRYQERNLAVPVMRSDRLAPIEPAFDIELVEVFCDCHYGTEARRLLNQMNHPEYENPLAKMTDDELVEHLTECSKDLEALRQEMCDA